MVSAVMAQLAMVAGHVRIVPVAELHIWALDYAALSRWACSKLSTCLRSVDFLAAK